MSDASLTIEHMEILGKHDPMIQNFLRRVRVETYDEFLDVLYDDIKIAIERLEQSPQLYVDEGEDATTQRLLDTLFGMTYGTHHNLQLGGNVDITIDLFRKGFRWIGEAKKFNNVREPLNNPAPTRSLPSFSAEFRDAQRIT